MNECNNAFNKLKDALTSAPILAYPKGGNQFILDTDAGHESIGAVLSQEIDGQECVIACFGKCRNGHVPKPTPKIARSLKDALTKFSKCDKQPTAPTAVAYIEEEHKLNIKHMEEEHKLRMELLRAKIEQTKAKTEVHKSLLATLKDSPKIFLQSIE
ncbi:hypothetical protein TNCT_52661 [Trichonephila clavata]|uniref:Reverse transcriptase/retrotransposon-derived protein RNase H-like domain-containing protein n=1 Tax=Trichonephila clavata TaxID=2740835 RepID=A0A8X6HR99_TRICU|nr:hypothetical protein TNCT_52661 [Trichonephila clavata]